MMGILYVLLRVLGAGEELHFSKSAVRGYIACKGLKDFFTVKVMSE